MQSPAKPLPLCRSFALTLCRSAHPGYLLDNIFCGYMDHWGNYPGGAKFKGHSYARIREFDTGKLIANVSQTVATSFVSALSTTAARATCSGSALNEDRCKQQCGNGAQHSASTDLRTFTSTDTGFKGKTCNTEVAKLDASSPSTLPPHKYVMILEPFTFLVNNNGRRPTTAARRPAPSRRTRRAAGPRSALRPGTTSSSPAARP